MRFKIFLLLAILVGSQSYSQLRNSFEAGVHLGVASFQSDYGERGDIKSGVTGNIGFAIGAAAYMNFFNRNFEWNTRTEWIAQHLKLKGELSYLRADLDHFIEGNDDNALKLQAMHGSSSVINLGGVLEYHFLDLTSFGAVYGKSYSPFVGLGAMANFSKPGFESSLGDYLLDPSILPDRFRTNAIFLDSQTVFSVLMSVGTRINVGPGSDIVIDSRWQYFTSDKIDGFSPSDSPNKHNDWMYYLSVGYVLYIN